MTTEQTRVDWFRIIDELTRQGVSLYGIEAAIGLSPQKLCGYKQGSEPKHTDGEALLGLWCQVTSKRREMAPTEKVPMSRARVGQ
jgi:hypothetical protein